MDDRLITIAIHTMPAARRMKASLEAHGIETVIQNVNLEQPVVAAGVRVRIHEADLPKALRIIENPDIFNDKMPARPVSARILVPVDFSPFAMRSCRAAFLLAARHNARVEIVHASVPPSSFDPQPLSSVLDFDGSSEILEDAAVDNDMRKMMDLFAARLRSEIKNGSIEAAPFTTRICDGLPEEVILEESKLTQPLLIVMGTRGSGKGKFETMGSVTAEVLDTCRFPVFTIPTNVSDHGFHDLVNVVYFATPDQQDILAIDNLYRLLPDHKLKVTLAILSQARHKPDQEALNRLLEYCVEHFPRFTFETRIFSNDDIEAVSKAIMDDPHPCDLLCVPNRRRNAIVRFFNPTLAHRLIFQADIPMLVIPV
ncbi:MAG: universal stress protein [Muribaculaceae bacterium]|nr:universal stress protein [Muribaculaceae bacterium]